MADTLGPKPDGAAEPRPKRVSHNKHGRKRSSQDPRVADRRIKDIFKATLPNWDEVKSGRRWNVSRVGERRTGLAERRGNILDRRRFSDRRGLSDRPPRSTDVVVTSDRRVLVPEIAPAAEVPVTTALLPRTQVERVRPAAASVPIRSSNVTKAQLGMEQIKTPRANAPDARGYEAEKFGPKSKGYVPLGIPKDKSEVVRTTKTGLQTAMESAGKKWRKFWKDIKEGGDSS